MAHQYMLKLFHGPHKNPPAPSYILNVRSLNYKPFQGVKKEKQVVSTTKWGVGDNVVL